MLKRVIQVERKTGLMRKERDATGKIIAGILAALIIVFTILRSFFGTELTDEALQIAETRLILQGGVPYVNNWLQTPGFTIFMLPLFKIYELAVPSREGLFIFFRFAFLAWKALILLGIFLCLHKLFDRKKYLFYMLLLPFSFSFWGTNNFHYNTISLYTILFAGCLLYYAFSFARKPDLCIICVGMLVALAIYNHPIDAMIVLVHVLIILFYTERKQRWKRLGFYCIGGFSVAAILSTWMIKAGGGGTKFN